jgi:parallel beta-helix repeat protein
VIAADGVTLDCAGHTVSGASGWGISLRDRTGVTVRNCRVTGFTDGIVLERSSGNTLDGNHARTNAIRGIALYGSTGNRVVGNAAVANGTAGFGGGFFVADSSDRNVLEDNVATDNGGARTDADGFRVQASPGRTPLE